MFATSLKERRRNSAIINRRRTLLEAWAEPKLRSAMTKAGTESAQEYARGGMGRVTTVAMADYRDRVRKILTDLYERTVRSVATAVNDSAKSTFQNWETKEDVDSTTARMMEIFRATALTRATSIAETMKDEVKRAVDPLVQEGAGEREIGRAIRKRVDGLKGYQANRIARTETLMSSSRAQDEVVRGLDDMPPLAKEWDSSRDSRTRRTHRGVRPVLMDELFTVGRSRMEYAGDPRGAKEEVINCRCVINYVPKEQMAELEEEVEDRLADIEEDERFQAEQTGRPVPKPKPKPKPKPAPKPKPVDEKPPEIPKPQPFRATGGVEFGDGLTDDEKAWHNLAGWSTKGDSDVTGALRGVSPLDDVKRWTHDPKSGDSVPSFFRASDNFINMRPDQSFDTDFEKALVWRHEYGHKADFSFNNKVVREAGFGNLVKVGKKTYQLDYDDKRWNVSVTLYGDMLKDGSKLTRSDTFANKLANEALQMEFNPDPKNQKKLIRGLKTNRVLSDKDFEDLTGMKVEDYVENYVMDKKGNLKGDFSDLVDVLYAGNFSKSTHHSFQGFTRMVGRATGGEKADMVKVVSYIQDVFHSSTMGRVGYGHGKDYYKQHFSIASTEMFATMTALYGTDKVATFKRIFSRGLPKFSAGFDKLMASASKLAKQGEDIQAKGLFSEGAFDGNIG